MTDCKLHSLQQLQQLQQMQPATTATALLCVTSQLSLYTMHQRHLGVWHPESHLPTETLSEPCNLFVQVSAALRRALQAALAPDSALASLQLSLPLAPEHIAKAASALPGCTSLRCLLLDGCQLDEASLEALQHGLGGNSSVIELSVVVCGLAPASARIVAAVLKERVGRCALLVLAAAVPWPYLPAQYIRSQPSHCADALSCA
jgi:hypothetical protein